MALHCQLTRTSCLFSTFIGTLVKKIRKLTERSIVRLRESYTTLSVNIHTFITTGLTLSAENSFRFVYTVWLAKM